MPGISRNAAITPESFDTFGELLRYLRRRARLTQQDLAIAVGYSVAQVCRFEQNRWQPDQATIAALFIPALDLKDAPEFSGRLMQFASTAEPTRTLSVTVTRTLEQEIIDTVEDLGAIEDIPAPPPQFVPRDVTLALVSDELEMNCSIALVGMAGLGKTALAAALAHARAQTQPVFWLTLTEGVTASVDAIVRQLALFLIANGQDHVEPILRERRESPMRLDQQISLIGAGLSAMRALLCFDNAHLVAHDAAVMQVLRHLIASTPSQVLFISRENVPLPNIVSVQMQGLAHAEATALIAQLGITLAPALAERLWRKTAGNPMLIRLAVGQMRGARLDVEKFIARLEHQPQVETYLLDAVLRKLSTHAARLAALLAVFRQPVDLYDEALIETIHATDGTSSWEGNFDHRRAIAELQRRRLIEHPLNAALHPLVHDHLYGALASDLPRRRRLHRIAAEWSTARGEIVQATYHNFRAGRLTQAVDIIADQGEALFNHGQAFAVAQLVEEMLEQARQREPKPDVLRRLLTARGDLLVLTSRAQDAEASYREALALAEAEGAAPAVRADMMRRLANRLGQRGQRAEALKMTLDALALLAPNDTLLRARLATLAATYSIGTAHVDEGETWANEALGLADEFARVSPRLADEIRARAYIELANVNRQRGDYASAIDFYRRAGKAASQAGLTHLEIIALGNVGGMLFDAGQMEESLRVRNQAIERAFAVGNSFAAANFLTHVASNYNMLGDYQTALAKLDQAIDLSRQMDDAEGVALAENQRATVLIAQGRVDEAHALIARVVRESESWLAGRMRCYFRDKLAVTQILKGQFAQAQETLLLALSFPAAQNELAVRLRLQTTLAMALLAEGTHRVDAAAQLLDKPLVDVPLWMELDRQLILAALALARGDANTARETARTTAERARAAGLSANARHAERLLRAADHPPPLADLPRLLWI